MWKLLAAALALLVLGETSNATPIPGSRTSVGSWQMGAFTFDTNDGFSHCAMSAGYNSGITMLFSVSGNFTWRVGWAHPSWHFTQGQKLDIALYVDGVGPTWVTAVASSVQGVAFAELPGNSALFDLFRKGYRLTVNAQGNQYLFNLTGTYAALTELANCASRYSGNPLPTAIAPPPPPSPLPTPRQPAAPQVGALTAEQRLEATTVVANLLAQGDLSGFHILTPKEVDALKIPELATWQVVWKSEEVVGVARIIPISTLKPSEISVSLISDDGKSCSGAFASGSTPDDKSKSTTRVFTVCKSEKTAWETHYILVPRDAGGYYLFGTISRSGNSETARSASSSADNLLRAAVFNTLKH